MSTPASRQYSWVDDAANGIDITAVRMDNEFDAVITKLNQKVIIQSSAPGSPIAGMLWYDSSNKLLKQYRNSEWVVNGVVHVDAAAPTTAQEGDLWYDTGTDTLKGYDGSSWVLITFDATNPGPIGSATPSTGAFTTLKVGTTNQGDILYDNGTTIIRLAPANAGDVLQSGGSAANPSWGTPIGSPVSKSAGSNYQAATAGFVVATLTAPGSTAGGYALGYTDSAASPTTLMGQCSVNRPSGGEADITGRFNSFMFPVKRGDYYRVDKTDVSGSNTLTMYFIPFGS